MTELTLLERIQQLGTDNIAIILKMMVDDIGELTKEVEQLKEALKDGTYCLG